MPFALAELHARYGDVVRIAPDELSLIDPSAWKDLMAPHKDRPIMQKDREYTVVISLEYAY